MQRILFLEEMVAPLVNGQEFVAASQAFLEQHASPGRDAESAARAHSSTPSREPAFNRVASVSPVKEPSQRGSPPPVERSIDAESGGDEAAQAAAAVRIQAAQRGKAGRRGLAEKPAAGAGAEGGGGGGELDWTAGLELPPPEGGGGLGDLDPKMDLLADGAGDGAGDGAQSEEQVYEDEADQQEVEDDGELPTGAEQTGDEAVDEVIWPPPLSTAH